MSCSLPVLNRRRRKLAVAIALLGFLTGACSGQRDIDHPTSASTGQSTPRAQVPRAQVPRAQVPRAQVVTTDLGVVVAGHPEAAELGAEVLRAGGSAMDAAVTVSFALAGAEPYGSGLGGKLMMLYYDADDAKVTAVDAMDQAGAAFDPARFAALAPEHRVAGWAPVAVPGLVAGMYEAHGRWGRLPWSQVVLPAADLARRGGEVLAGTVKLFERRIDRIRTSEQTRRLYLPGDRLPEVGDRLANPDLARTLETIAEQGAAGFYQGSVARAIVDAAAGAGGSISLQDLATYRPRVVEPASLKFGPFEVVSGPPPATGGATVLLALNQLKEAAWSGNSVLEPANLDRVARVLRRIYPKIQAGIADSPGARDVLDELLAAPMTSADSTFPSTGGKTKDSKVETGSTSHFVVVDHQGNVASVTQSLSHHFGAGVVAPGTGVLFNNTLKNFTYDDPDSPNTAAPGKRPRSTIAPTLVLRAGRPTLAIGLPGGQRIPTATLQILLDVLVFGVDTATAITQPRLHLVRPSDPGESAHVFDIEPAARFLEADLVAAGWQVQVNEDDEAFGGFCAIEIHSNGSRAGIADHRRTNAARRQLAPASLEP